MNSPSPSISPNDALASLPTWLKPANFRASWPKTTAGRVARLGTYLVILLVLLVFFAWRQHGYETDLFHHQLDFFLPSAYAAGIATGLVIVNDLFLFPAFFRPDTYLTYGILFGLLIFAAGFIPIATTDCDCETVEAPPVMAYWVIGGLSTALLAYRGMGKAPTPPAVADQLVLQKDAELKYLRDQVNPHFLFNTLNSIYALAKQQSEQTPEVVHQLSTLLRYQLESAQLETVSLRKELDFIQDYLLLEDTRLGDRCRIEFELSRQPARYLIYPMVLLPFVENAFKHGANATRGESYIRVAAEIADATLDFTVENSRVPGVKVAGTGTGLANVKRRLDILYPNRHELVIEDQEPETYRIQLQLQLHVA